MSANSWTLTDVDSHIFQAEWKQNLTAGVVAEKRILRGGKQEGVDSVRIQSDDFSFEVLPTRGMNIWKVWTGDFEYGWKSPARGPVNPALVPLMEPGGLGWLDGFDELFVRCGLESNGAPEFDDDNRLKYPLHGKIANTPARKVEVQLDGDVVKVIGVVEEARFHFLKLRLTSTLSWKMGTTQLEVSDEIENLSASDAEFQMLYHINFGAPLLDAGSQFVAPIAQVVPRNDHAASGIDAWDHYLAPTPGYEEQVYFLELAGDESETTRSLLKNAHGTRGVELSHQVKDLPCYSVWKNTTSLEDGYVTGLEPGTNFPNPRSFEGDKGRFVSLSGGQKKTLSVGMNFLVNEDQVAASETAVKQLMPQDSTVHKSPKSDWCHGIEE